MAVIVNNPPAYGRPVAYERDSGSGFGFLLGLIVLLGILFLFFYYGIPALRRPTVVSPQIQVPDRIDVNVNNPGK